MSLGSKTSTSASAQSNQSGVAKHVTGNKRAAKIQTRFTMWLTSRRRIICLPKHDAVCSSQRSGIDFTARNAQSTCKNDEQRDFFTWLRSRGEHSSGAISIGMSSHGRALFASRPIYSGECMLQVSRELMITPDKLHEDVTRLLSKDVSDWARLALFLLAHERMGQSSAWAPYIRCLPRHREVHSTIFWSKEELACLKHSPLHRETIQRRAVIRTEYAAVQTALQLCPQIFGNRVTLRDFKHAYATVCSRAWGIEALGALALVPLVDFSNHDSSCRALLSYDEARNCAEVVADRDYSPGEQVVISYGQLSNAILALDFGFALPVNPHDQAELWMSLSRKDPLHESKLKLFHSHNMQMLRNGDNIGNCFTLEEVKSLTGQGKGIPQSLRAFARVCCASSLQELNEMAESAAALDGRLARRPLNDNSKELQAMQMILTHIDSKVEQHLQSTLTIRDSTTLRTPRREIAEAVLEGELRVLRSASAWLTQYCKSLEEN